MKSKAAKKRAGDKYRAANKEKIAAQRREYRARRREALNVANREYYAATKEQRAELVRARRAANKEKQALLGRAWYVANKQRHAAKGRAWRLKACGFTEQLFTQLLAFQNGVCAICRQPFGRMPHADHCHKTKQARGLLCRFCNVAEGIIKRTGLTPLEFAEELTLYLAHPPAKALGAG